MPPADGTHILRLHCLDRPGIVAAVAGCLRDCGCNIDDAAMFNDTLSGRFFMRAAVRPAEEGATVANFAAAFQGIAGHYGMDWHLTRHGERVRTVVMVSRADHCLNDILYRWRTGHLLIDIAAVVSNHETNRRLVEDRGLRFVHLPVDAETRSEQEDGLAALIDASGTELIVLARYMQVLTDRMCARYPGRIINIHHSFLPSFRGARPYHQAYERGVKLIGATAHFVTADLDEGPIIEQQTTRIDHTMGPEALQVLGRDIEAQVLARALLFYTERRLFLHGGRTVVL